MTGSLDAHGRRDGRAPRGVAGHVDPTSDRVRALRAHPAILSMFGAHPVDPFWDSKCQTIALRSAVLLNSSWVRVAPRPVPINALARAAGLSTRTAHTMIGRAVSTGDLVRRPDDGDARLRILEPTARLIARVEAQIALWFDLMSRFTGRANPLAAGDSAAAVRARRAFLMLTLWTEGRASTWPKRAPRALVFTVWDVLLETPQDASAFVAREAMRLGVVPLTIRNAIARARQEGWLEPGPGLAASALGRQRCGTVLTLLERYWNAALNMVECGGGQDLDETPAVPMHLRARPRGIGWPAWPPATRDDASVTACDAGTVSSAGLPDYASRAAPRRDGPPVQKPALS
jgi:hypothetical protein